MYKEHPREEAVQEALQLLARNHHFRVYMEDLYCTWQSRARDIIGVTAEELSELKGELVAYEQIISTAQNYIEASQSPTDDTDM